MSTGADGILERQPDQQPHTGRGEKEGEHE